MQFLTNFSLVFIALFSTKVMAMPSLLFSQKTLHYKKHTWTLELAQTPQEKRKGLMFRESITSNNAMLFVYDTPQEIHVWMKNTLIPLDILWLDKDLTILAIRKGEPLSTKVMSPNVMANYLLEMKEGLTDELQLSVGDHFN